MTGVADKRLFIDSSLQHAAAALNKKSIVLWVATQPKIFGYDVHHNIGPKKEYLEGNIDSYLFDYNFTGTIYECPYKNIEDIHDSTEIVAAVEAQEQPLQVPPQRRTGRLRAHARHERGLPQCDPERRTRFARR